MFAKLLSLGLISTLGSVTALAAVEDPTSWLQSLVSTGPLGIVLAWFMWWFGKKSEAHDVALREAQDAFRVGLQELRDALDRTNRAQLALIMSLKGISEAGREQAQNIIQEIDRNKL